MGVTEYMYKKCLVMVVMACFFMMTVMGYPLMMVVMDCPSILCDKNHNGACMTDTISSSGTL